MWACELDEGRYWSSQRTMYRILAAAGQGGERRRQATHPPRAIPELVAEAPNVVWSWDTYVRTWAGFVYVAFILDVYSRRIVSWHACTSKQTDSVMTPLKMAFWQREREGHPVTSGRLLHHSDAGSQYTSLRLTRHLDVEKISASLGSVGDAYDNALMESGNGLYKTECIRTDVFHRGPYRTISDAEYATAGWVEWCNNRRLHSAIGRLTPMRLIQPACR